MRIRQIESDTCRLLDGSEFEKNLGKYYALLEHSNVKDVKLFFYGEITLLLEDKLAQERQLRQSVEKELNRLRAAYRVPAIEGTVTENQCESGEAIGTVKEIERLKAELERAWNVASMIEENLCKKEIELDVKDQKVRELKEKLKFAMQQSRVAAFRLRDEYQTLVNIPVPVVDMPNFTVEVLPIQEQEESLVKDAHMPRLEHPTKRVKVEPSAKSRKKKKVDYLISKNAVKKPGIEPSKSVKRKKEYQKSVKKIKLALTQKRIKVDKNMCVPCVSLISPTIDRPVVKSNCFLTPKNMNLYTTKSQREIMRKNQGLSYKTKIKFTNAQIEEELTRKNQMFTVRKKYKPMFIFCVHCKETRHQFPRTNGGGTSFRHTCSMVPTAKRVSQNLRYKNAMCKLEHEGPCARLATVEEIRTCKKKYREEGQHQTIVAKVKSETN